MGVGTKYFSSTGPRVFAWSRPRSRKESNKRAFSKHTDTVVARMRRAPRHAGQVKHPRELGCRCNLRSEPETV